MGERRAETASGRFRIGGRLFSVIKWFAYFYIIGFLGLLATLRIA